MKQVHSPLLNLTDICSECVSNTEFLGILLIEPQVGKAMLVLLVKKAAKVLH